MSSMFVPAVFCNGLPAGRNKGDRDEAHHALERTSLVSVL